ncbi:MAG TPA: hypothetical protein VGJ15_08125 [Pirellulales bacterium]
MFVVMMTALAVGWYLFHGQATNRLPGGSSAPGLVFGIVGAAIMLFEFLLWPRKLARRWRLGSARAWMRAHIWLGLLTVPLIWLHSGFKWGGPLSTVLAGLFIVVIVSGIYGLAMQNWLPRLMLVELPGETITLEATHVAHDLCLEAEQIVAAVCGIEPDVLNNWRRRESDSNAATPRFHSGAPSLVLGSSGPVGNVAGGVLQSQLARQVPGSEPLQHAFVSEIGPFLWWGGRHRQLSEPGRGASYFRNLRIALEPEVRSTADLLEGYCDQRRQFDRQARLHRWLHGWLLVHLPLSIILIVLMFVHAFVALKYR